MCHAARGRGFESQREAGDDLIEVKSVMKTPVSEERDDRDVLVVLGGIIEMIGLPRGWLAG